MSDVRIGNATRGRRRFGKRFLLFLLLAGCIGYATQPTGITTSGATLHGQASCSANTTTNGCAGWFQYWQDGSSTLLETSHVVANVNVTLDFNQAVTGLSSGTLYHYEICGYGDTNINPPGLCTGPLTGSDVDGANAPGTTPDPGDLNATANFRTASATTSGTVDLGRVLSTADTSDKPISRDGGVSVQYSSNPPLSLWIFGDTQQNHVGFIPFGSAAEGPFTAGQAPTALDELPTPPTAPQNGRTAPAPFFPPPAPLLRVNGTACGSSGSYAADWLMGGAQIPGSSTLLLVYGELCIESSPLAFTLERVALAQYDPIGNTFLTVDHPFQASPLNAGIPVQKGLGSPVFANGYVYLYASDCEGLFCSTKGAIYVARVVDDESHWANGANFKWWNGSAWTTTSTAAATIIAGATPLGVSVGDYSATTSKKFVLLEQTGLGTAGFQAYEATSPKGPWTAGPAAQPADACTGGSFGCYAATGHPELSTSSQLVYSWYSVDDRDGYGHVRIGAVDW